MATPYNVSREQIEVHRFSVPVAEAIVVVAVFLQAFVPLRFPWFGIFDLPMLVTIFFGMARRSQVTGLLTGGAIGLLQDSLTHQPIGLYGMANTVVGYCASSLGVKIDVENPGTRMLMTFGFYLLHQIVYYSVAWGLVGQTLYWRWGHESVSAVANALLAIGLFALLDRFRQRT